MSSRTLCAYVLLAAVGACAKAPETAPSPASSGAIITDGQTAAAPAQRNRDIITREEMAGANVGSRSVLEAVTTLRPAFLNVRGLHNIAAVGGDPEAGKVHASIDGNKLVSLDELKGIVASTVREIRYLNASQAMQKFGGDAREGPVILVTSM